MFFFINRSNLIAIFLSIGLAIPLIILSINNISLVGMGEESVGYRYFYSLRILYESTSAPTLPQGHLVSVIHVFIQYLMTKMGFLINDIEQRINVFSYIGSIVPLIVTGVAYCWAIQPVKSVNFKLWYAFLLLMVSYQLRVGGGYHLVIPDYYIWVLPLSICAFGFAVLDKDSPGYIFKNWFGYGLYVSACYTMKATYLIMPAFVYLIALTNLNSTSLREVFSKTFLPSVKIAITAFSFTLLVFMSYYKGSLRSTLKHFSPQYYSQFVETGDPSYLNWINSMFDKSLPDLCTITALLPYILFVWMIFSSSKKSKLVLIFPAIFSCCIAYKRPYPPTYVETSVFTLLVAMVAVYNYLKPLKFNVTSKRISSTTINLIISVMLIGCSILVINNFFKNFYLLYLNSNKAEVALNNYLNLTSGKTLFVITNNHYRPTTVDSAIFKGGMNLNNNIWPSSKLVSSFVTNRSYIVTDYNPKINLSEFSKVVFVAAAYSIEEQKNNINKLYGINFADYSCDFSYDLGIGGINWFLPYVNHKINTNSYYLPNDANVSRTLVGCKVSAR